MTDKVLKIISAISAIVVAILTGYVTYVVTVIEQDTKKSLSQSQQDIDRAKLFRELIADLKDPDNANYALLVLWSVYPKEAYRKMIVLAALEAQNERAVETLIRLDQELKPYLETIQKASKSSNREIAEAANRIIRQITPEDAARVYLESLSSVSLSELDPYSDALESLFNLMRASESVRSIVQKEMKKKSDLDPVLAYGLLQAGKSQKWDELVNRAISKPKEFSRFVPILCCREFPTDQMLSITDLTLSYLSAKDAVDTFDAHAGFKAVSGNKFDLTKFDENRRHKLANVSRVHFVNHQSYKYTRYYAFRTLQMLDWRFALFALADLKKAGNADEFLKKEIDKFLYGDNERQSGVVSSNPELAIPAYDATAEDWGKWLAKHADSGPFQ